MTKYFKEHKDKIFVFCIFLFIFLCLLSKIMVEQVSNLDELWNYNIARNIAKGLIPYKDISMITTPLLPIIEAVIIKLTVDELYIFRIMNSLLLTSIIYSTYRLLFKLNNNRIHSCILSLIFIPILGKDLFLDYNFFILFLVLVITNLELHILNKENSKIDFGIGLIGGLCFCTKQTVGMVICFEILLFQLIKPNKEKKLKKLVNRLVGILIPIILLIIYLISTDSTKDFFSYTFLSIGTFDNSIAYSKLILSEDTVIRFLSCMLPSFVIGIIIYLIGAKDKKSNRYMQILTLFFCATSILVIEYPIFDRVHFLVSNYIVIIILLFAIYEAVLLMYKKTNFKLKKYIKLVLVSFVLLFSITKTIICTYENFNLYYISEKNEELKHYNKLIVSDFIKNMYYETKEVEEKYEQQGKTVNILDSFAVVIHIPMEKYIKNYDMFNKGNLGQKGEEGIIETIRNDTNQVYLIKKDGLSKNWQNPNKISNYIKDNLRKIDETNMYNIYE